MNETTKATLEQSDFELLNYDSARLKKDIAPHVTRLIKEGFDPRSQETYVEAMNCLARRYGITAEELSVLAHVHDWQKKDRKNFMAYVKNWMTCQQTEMFDDLAVKLPPALLIDDDEVPLGDERMTLAIAVEQLSRSLGMTEKETDALREALENKERLRRDLKEQKTAYDRLISIATEKYGVGADKLIYNREKKAWQPEKSA